MIMDRNQFYYREKEALNLDIPDEPHLLVLEIPNIQPVGNPINPQNHSMIQNTHKYLCLNGLISKLIGTVQTAKVYAAFENQKGLEVEVNTILQRIKNNKDITIIRDRALLKQSENAMKVRLVNYDQSAGVAVYLLYISIFQIKTKVKVYLQEYQPGPKKPQFQGGNGDIYPNKNGKQCVKAVRLKQGYSINLSHNSLILDGRNSRHKEFFRVLKEWAVCTIAGALQVGPNTLKYSNRTQLPQCDLQLYRNHVTFKMQYFEPLSNMFSQWTPDVNKTMLKLVDAQISKAIVQLHKVKIIHRDINPNNILYDRAKHKFLLCDFGFSIAVAETPMMKSLMVNIGATQGFAHAQVQNQIIMQQQHNNYRSQTLRMNLFYVDLVGLKKTLSYIVQNKGIINGQRTTHLKPQTRQQQIRQQGDYINLNTTLVVRGLDNFTGRAIQLIDLGQNRTQTKIIYNPPQKQTLIVDCNVSKQTRQRMGCRRTLQLASLQQFLQLHNPIFLDDYASECARIESWLQIKNTMHLTLQNLYEVLDNIQQKLIQSRTLPGGIVIKNQQQNFYVDYLKLWRQILNDDVTLVQQHKTCLQNVKEFAVKYIGKQCMFRYLSQIISWTPSRQLSHICIQLAKSLKLQTGRATLGIPEARDVVHLLVNSALESLTSLNRFDAHLIQKVNVAQEALQSMVRPTDCTLNLNSTYGLILLIKAIFYTCIDYKQSLAIQYSWHAYCVIKDCFGIYSCYYQSIVYNLFLLYRQQMTPPIKFDSVSDCLKLALTQKEEVVTILNQLKGEKNMKTELCMNLQNQLKFLMQDTQQAIEKVIGNQIIYYLDSPQFSQKQAECAKSHVWLMGMAFPFHYVQTQRMLNKVLQKQNISVVKNRVQIKLEAEWRIFQKRLSRYKQLMGSDPMYPKFAHTDQDNLGLVINRIERLKRTRPLVRFDVRCQELRVENES